MEVAEGDGVPVALGDDQHVHPARDRDRTGDDLTQFVVRRDLLTCDSRDRPVGLEDRAGDYGVPGQCQAHLFAKAVSSDTDPELSIGKRLSDFLPAQFSLCFLETRDDLAAGI
ncbi:MAG: hypothetical protein ACI8PQ_002975 [Planctomycetota bacterium]|jgi:hypothetical protein